jgi:hypothetical protein
VPVESERVLEAGSEEGLGAGAHADAAVAGVVRDGEELDVHAMKLLPQSLLQVRHKLQLN